MTYADECIIIAVTSPASEDLDAYYRAHYLSPSFRSLIAGRHRLLRLD